MVDPLFHKISLLQQLTVISCKYLIHILIPITTVHRPIRYVKLSNYTQGLEPHKRATRRNPKGSERVTAE